MTRLNLKLKLSQREAALLLALLLLALSLAGWRFLFSPLQQKAAQLRREQAALLSEQERILEQLQHAEALFAEKARWQPRAEALQRRVPSPDRLAEVLAQLESLLEAAPLTLHMLQIGEIEPGESFAASQVRLRLSGEAAALLHLLNRLEQFEHLLLIEQFAWSRDGAETASLDLSFRLIFHPSP